MVRQAHHDISSIVFRSNIVCLSEAEGIYQRAMILKLSNRGVRRLGMV